MPTRTVAADEAWLGRWTGPIQFTLDGGRMRPGASGRDADLHLGGTVIPGFRDAHVHLELVDARALFAGGLEEVYDLGAGLDAVATWPSPDGPPVEGMPRVRFAGQFLTARGGYPSDRAWAPAGSVREIGSAEDAVAAVREQVCAGSAFVKITVNAAAGPVFDDDTLTAVVSAAHAASRGVIAHAEGPGQAGRALAAGVDVLAHTPWTEALEDSVIHTAARSMLWISTLAIHRGPELDVAVDNLRRFHAAGGRVRYGTDLGNGDLPEGPNPAEVMSLLDAGLGRAEILDAMIDGDAGARFAAGLQRFTWIPGTPPAADADFADWLAGARIVAVSDLDLAPDIERGGMP